MWSPSRRRRETRFAPTKPRQPTRTLAFDQRPERLADHGGFLAQAGISLSLFQQFVIKGEGRTHLPHRQGSARGRHECFIDQC